MNATLVKVGGSLALQCEKLRILCKRLNDFSKTQQFVVIPGGGEFADTVRAVDLRFNLSCRVAHRMAIVSMDQYGLLLFDLMDNSIPISKFEEVENVLDLGRLPIFLPSSLMINEDPLENSWYVTSDAIAVYLASRLRISKVLLVTDVDGIYTSNPKKYPDAKLLRKIPVKELLEMGERTSVDKLAPLLASKYEINCFVVNGLFPERVIAILEGKDAISTRIV